MFSGIIQSIGEVVSSEAGSLRIRSAVIAGQVRKGSSVSVSGVCLTVEDVKSDLLVFSFMPETSKKTTLGAIGKGHLVNLEPSLRVGDELGGHFVYGHVDGVGVVVALKAEGNATLVTLRLPNDLIKFMSPQGSLTVDGVSLTAARVDASAVTMSLVSYTKEHTTLGRLRENDMVNIECDMLAKYILSFYERREIFKT